MQSPQIYLTRRYAVHLVEHTDMSEQICREKTLMVEHLFYTPNGHVTQW